MVFECFHNFNAFSAWGDTLYNIMLKLEQTSGDPAVKAWFKKTMESNYDKVDAGAFTPLERLVMELLRVISPAPGAISTLHELPMPSLSFRERTSTPFNGKTRWNSIPIAISMRPRAIKPARARRRKSGSRTAHSARLHFR
jgi:hypothetical protein